jgi:hypothetical protein
MAPTTTTTNNNGVEELEQANGEAGAPEGEVRDVIKIKIDPDHPPPPSMRRSRGCWMLSEPLGYRL